MQKLLRIKHRAGEKQARPATINEILQKLLAELEEQKKATKMILKRISILEASNMKAANKKK